MILNLVKRRKKGNWTNQWIKVLLYLAKNKKMLALMNSHLMNLQIFQDGLVEVIVKDKLWEECHRINWIIKMLKTKIINKKMAIKSNKLKVKVLVKIISKQIIINYNKLIILNQLLALNKEIIETNL